MTKIVNFSGQAQHGKTTSANFMKSMLEKQGKTALIVNYADYLKFICKEYFNWSGKKDESGRTILQNIGTDIVRNRNPDFWVEIVDMFIKTIGCDFDYILVGDCRFVNECEYFKSDYDVMNVHIVRNNFDNGLTQEQKNHPSEKNLLNYRFNYEIEASTLLGLEHEIEYMVCNNKFFR